MNQISTHVGARIRMYRKSRQLTLQELAERIHKSKSCLSKYENGEISMDIETLSEIASVLEVSLNQLTDFAPSVSTQPENPAISGMTPFFQARRLYFYFYDGRYHRLKDGIIDVRESEAQKGSYEAALSIRSQSQEGQSSEVYYTGKVVYSDMLIRFSFVNQYNALEEDLLYIFNPLEIRDSTYGLLCGISSADLMPCAFKCLVTLSPREHSDAFIKQLLISKKELHRWQKMNMLLIDNQGV